MLKYKTILLKLSGESLSGNTSDPINPKMLQLYATEISALVHKGVRIGIVLGGGNIFRGMQGANIGFDRIQGDYMGMLATVINSLALQGALEALGIKARVLSGIEIDPLCERTSSKRAIELLDQNYVVILAGGTGNPFFTTDTAAALRAVELKADVLMKGTRVAGVFNADPEKDASAVKYDQLTFEEAYRENLKIMDLTAFTLCSENNLPVIVFNIHNAGELYEIIVEGKNHGTVVFHGPKKVTN